MKRHIIYTFFVVAVATALASCINEDEIVGGDCIIDDEDNAKITFTIVTNDDGRTRADNDGTDNKQWKDITTTDVSANDYETRIDDLQVFVYDTNNKYLGKVQNLSYSRIGQTDNNHYQYSYTGSLPASISGDKVSAKFVIIANGNTYEPTTASTLNDMASQVLSYGDGSGFKTVSGLDAPATAIPMWGVLEVNDCTLKAGWSTDIGDIYLLRTVAKLKVQLNTTNLTDYHIYSATLSDYNQTMNIVPRGYKSINGTNIEASFISCTDTKLLYTDDSSTKNQNDETFNPNASQANAAIAFEKNSDGSLYLYLPEYDNTNATAQLAVTLKLGTTEETAKSYTFLIDRYTDGNAEGTRVDLVRNHVYTYQIDDIDEATSRLDLQFTELPWNLVQSSIGWNVEPPAPYTAMLYAWNNKTNIYNDVNYMNFQYPSFRSNRKTIIDDNATLGDPEAACAFVTYPRVKDGGSIKGIKVPQNTYIEDKRAGADFYLIMSVPEGAVWKAHLTNETDFEFDTEDTWNFNTSISNGKASTEEHYCATTGIVRGMLTVEDETKRTTYTSFQPYKIQIKPKNKWYDVNSDAISYTDDDGVTCYKLSEVYSSSLTNTTAGINFEKTYGETSGPYTDFYITVSLDGVHEYMVPINPVVSLDDDRTYYTNDATTYGKRRFATGSDIAEKDRDYYIRIWQLKVRPIESGKDTGKAISNVDMAEANKANVNFKKK